MSSIDLATYLARVEVDTGGLEKGLNNADKSIQGKLNSTMKSITSGFKKLGVGIAVTKVAKDSIDAIGSVQSEMNKVFTLLPEMSGKSMKEMENQARDLSMEVGKLPEEVIPAIYSSLSAGVPKDNVFDYVSTASKMAVAGGTETEIAVEGLASVINAYGMETTEAEKVSDMFFITLKNGMTSIPELSHSLSQVTPIASSMGVEFEEVAGAMATMTAQGLSTATASNQIKSILAELGKEGTKSSDIFKEISGVAFPQFIENGGELNEALAMMEEYANANNISMLDMFSSVQAGQGALALTGENMESFVEDINAMNESAGATNIAFDKMDKGIERTKERINVLTNEIKLLIGDALAPFVEFILTGVVKALKTLISWFKKTDETSQETVDNIESNTITKVKNIWSVISDVFSSFIGLVDDIANQIKGIIEENEQAFKDLAEVIIEIFTNLMEFLGIVVNKVRDVLKANEKELKALAKLVFDTFETITKAISVALKVIIDVATLFWDNFGGLVETTFGFIVNIINDALSIIKGVLDVFIGVFTGDWERMWEGIKSIVEGIFGAIIDFIVQALNNIVGILTGAIGLFFDTAKKLFGGILKGAIEIFADILKQVGEFLTNVIKAITDSFGKAKESGRGMFKAVWDGMKSIWSSIANWVGDKVRWLTDKLSFWRSSSSEMSSGGSGRSKRSGSYATGSRFIKQDGWNMLHKGEMVVPATLNPFNPKNIDKGGFYNNKFGNASGSSNAEYNVEINIDKVESEVDIEKAVDKGIKKAEERRERNLKKRGF